MKALIIVDPQNDFMPGGALETPNGDEIIPMINELQYDFDLVVASQDWHPRNHMRFASQHSGHEPFQSIDVDGEEQTLWPEHCVQGSVGAEIHPELKMHRIEAVIRKGMDPEIDSYSVFFDKNRERKTGLSGYLKEKGAQKLYFCGLATDVCVYYSIMDALEEGFEAALITDATRPHEPERFEDLLSRLENKGVEVVQSKVLVE